MLCQANLLDCSSQVCGVKSANFCLWDRGTGGYSVPDGFPTRYWALICLALVPGGLVPVFSRWDQWLTGPEIGELNLGASLAPRSEAVMLPMGSLVQPPPCSVSFHRV